MRTTNAASASSIGGRPLRGTEVFFLPAAAHTEKDGSFTNTQRMLQWHHKAVEPAGDQRSELWFYYHLGRIIRDKLAGSSDPRDRPYAADRARGLPGRARRVHRVLRPRAAGDGVGAATGRPGGRVESGWSRSGHPQRRPRRRPPRVGGRLGPAHPGLDVRAAPGLVHRLQHADHLHDGSAAAHRHPVRGAVHVAMGLHFVLTDRSLEEHYPDRFGRGGRIALAAALLAGWAADALLAPTSTLLVALLIALLGGSILLNVFKEEIPSGHRSSFPRFLTGLLLYAALLAAVTAISE